MRKKWIPCVVENYDTILKMRRPNGSSASWYLKEEGKLNIPGNFADMHFMDRNKVMTTTYERTYFDEITTDDYKDILPEAKLEQVKYAINKLSTCIKYITISDLDKEEYKDKHYFYIISMWNGDFWERHKDIGFECIHNKVKEDIKNQQCTLIFEYTAEPHSWNALDMFKKLEEWRLQSKFPANSLYFLSGNLLAEDIVKENKYGYKAKGFSTFEAPLKPASQIPKYNPTDKANLFLNYNRRPRVHRLLFLHNVIKDGIMDRGLCSYGSETFNDADYFVKNGRILYKSAANPHGSYDRICEVDQEVCDNLDKHELRIGDQSLVDNLALTPYVYEDYSSTFLSVVNETNIDNNILFLSEKIWKPILLEHPFLVIGNPFTLQKLREMGYKTFGDYWDESYDEITSFPDRIRAVNNILIDLSKKSVAELKALRVEMEDILAYNRATFNVTLNQYFYGRNDILPVGDFLEELYKKRSNARKTII